MNKCIVGILLFLFSAKVFAAACVDVFPDAVSNTQNSASINFGFNSQILNSLDGVIDTQNLTDNSGGVSCGGIACSNSNTTSETGNFNSFVNNQPSISLGFQQAGTVSPGDYDNLTLNTQAELTMAPGVYTFRGSITMQFQSQIIVGSPGTVVIYVRGQSTFNSSSVVNSAGNDRHVFIFSRDDISIQSSATLNSIIYTRGNITLQNQALVTGAISARGNITLNSASTVDYSFTAVANTDFDGFCEGIPTVPDPIADWRLDEGAWNGTANEVLDSSSNGLNGVAVGLNGLPGNDDQNPVRSGSPGTCRYGDFNGQADGYVEIADPGFNSILDLDNEFTVTVWVYARTYATSGLATIVSKDENFEFHLNGSGQINWWWGGGNRSLTTSQTVPLSSWNHIAITFRSGEQHIYINGVSAAQTNSTDAITVNNDSVFIGTDWNFHSRRFDGLIDEVKIYDAALSEAQVGVVMNEDHDCATGPVLDYFNIDVGAGNASVCAPATVTISARDSSDNVLIGYTGTIDITTSTNNGDWSIASAAGTLTTGAADSGTASYEFESSGLDQGEIDLDLENQHAETLTITVSDANQAVSSTSATITFSENAFQVIENDTLDEDVIAGREHQFSVSMLLRRPDQTLCGPATNYNATDVRAWISRSAADPAGAAPTMNNSDASASVSLADSEASSQTIAMNFSSGVASFSLDTTDVGQYSIQFYDDSLLFSDQAIRGGSNTLTVRPFAFVIEAVGNPAAGDASGLVYLEAGENFDVTIRAVGWNSADDVNDDGRADTFEDSNLGNNVLNGSVLTRFGQENPAETVTLSAAIVAPSTQNPGLGDNGSDGNIVSGFSAGSATAVNRHFVEVGIITIAAELTDDYLGATDTVKSDSVSIPVGRFIPSYFELIGSALDTSCSTFWYLDRPRETDLTVEARNRFDQITRNYEGNFAKLSLDSQLVLGAIDSIVPTSLNSRVSKSNTVFNWAQGTGSIGTDLTLARAPGAPDASNALFSDVNIGVALTDSDNVALQNSSLDLDTDNNGASDTINIGNDEYRFGRVILPSAHGPESAALSASFVTQYWTGSGWRDNTDDNCTVIPATAITIEGNPVNSVSNLTVTVGSGNSTASFFDNDLTRVAFQNGDAGLSFSAPGAGNTDSIDVDVDLSSLLWLRFDWNQDGSYSDDDLPTAEFSFGRYRGHDRIIYWQEVLGNP